MNKEEGIKLNNAFDEFCQNFNIKSALAYFATADGESVALAFHNVTDAEIENLIGNLVNRLALKQGRSSDAVWAELKRTTPEYVPERRLN